MALEFVIQDPNISLTCLIAADSETWTATFIPAELQNYIPSTLPR